MDAMITLWEMWLYFYFIYFFLLENIESWDLLYIIAVVVCLIKYSSLLWKYFYCLFWVSQNKRNMFVTLQCFHRFIKLSKKSYNLFVFQYKHRKTMIIQALGIAYVFTSICEGTKILFMPYLQLYYLYQGICKRVMMGVC